MQNKCQCESPTSSCPRYGWMKGRKWQVCQGIDVSDADREKLLELWSGELPVAKPSLLKQATNFSRTAMEAGKHLITQGELYASQQVIEERLATCRACPQLDENERCNACGCYVEVKTKMVVSRCPEGKWEAVGSAQGKCCGG